MKVEPVTVDDLPEIALWHARRGMDEGWPREWLSDLGFQVRGVAAGWLITTNTARAMIEDFVSNPDAPKAERRAAIEVVESRIIEEARRLGFRYILGSTNLETMRERAIDLGYHVTPREFSFAYKDLTK